MSSNRVADTQRVEQTTKPKGFTMYDVMQTEAREFLDSMGRNSWSTQRTYAAGLLAFHRFLQQQQTDDNNNTNTLKGIVKSITQYEIDVYSILNDFVSYLMKQKHPLTGSPITIKTTRNYVIAVKSYFQFYEIDIVTNKFKRKVKMPRIYREDEEALDVSDIRTILLSCNSRRLKPYLLVLASAGLRANEASHIRLCDIDFNVNPTKIHVRKEFAKTRVSRDVYISDEATKHVKQWIAWKYRTRKCRRLDERVRTPQQTDLVFTNYKSIVHGRAIYTKLRKEFARVLRAVGLEKRKDEGQQRRTITLHSFRRYVKTVISDQVSKDFSEWFLGHSKSPYYTMKESMRREYHRDKCMKYLTYLDYSALESTGRNIERQLEAKDSEIQTLTEKLKEHDLYLKKLEEMVKRINEQAREYSTVARRLSVADIDRSR